MTTRQADAHVEILIADTGSGIAPTRLATIFDSFTTTRHDGLGLGLPTSRHLVHQLGGTIDVVSEHGVGTTFTLRFPIAQA